MADATPTVDRLRRKLTLAAREARELGMQLADEKRRGEEREALVERLRKKVSEVVFLDEGAEERLCKKYLVNIPDMGETVNLWLSKDNTVSGEVVGVHWNLGEYDEEVVVMVRVMSDLEVLGRHLPGKAK